jgi:hypothetical protein
VVLLHSAFWRIKLFNSQYSHHGSRGDMGKMPNRRFDGWLEGDSSVGPEAEGQNVHESVDNIHRYHHGQVSMCIFLTGARYDEGQENRHLCAKDEEIGGVNEHIFGRERP